MIKDKPGTKYLKDYTPPAFWITDIDLTFEITDKSTSVTSITRITKNQDVADENTLQYIVHTAGDAGEGSLPFNAGVKGNDLTDEACGRLGQEGFLVDATIGVVPLAAFGRPDDDPVRQELFCEEKRDRDLEERSHLSQVADRDVDDTPFQTAEKRWGQTGTIRDLL